MPDNLPVPGPLDVIRRHPPLAAELARRFTGAPLPAPDQTAVDLTDTAGRLTAGDHDVPAISARVTGKPDSDAGGEAAVTVTIAALGAGCQLTWQQEAGGPPGTPVEIGPGSRAKLQRGGPWMVIFAAVIGAADLMREKSREAVLAAIDDVGGGPAGSLALMTLVMRAAPEQARDRLETDMGTNYVSTMFEETYADGYAHGLQRGRTDRTIVLVLTARGITLTDAQRDQIAACDDGALLARWFSRALTAAAAADVLAA